MKPLGAQGWQADAGAFKPAVGGDDLAGDGAGPLLAIAPRITHISVVALIGICTPGCSAVNALISRIGCQSGVSI